MTRTPPPIFVVGASRSGTALVRSLLNNHPDIHLAGETHYFDDLRPRMRGRERSIASPDDHRICQDYFLALTHRPYGHGGDPEKATMSREVLRAEADRHGGADGYFEAFCRLEALEHEKPRWGEKTPRHVYRLAEMLTRYPDAQAIAMVRDPRAVVASYRDWRNQGGFDLDADPDHESALEHEERRARLSYNIVIQSLLWRSTVNAAHAARARFGRDRVYVLRYEDLLADAAGISSDLCRWLSVDPSPALLDVPVHNSSFSGYDAHGGIRQEARDRWRRMLDTDEVLAIQTTCGAVMVEAGYPHEPVPRSWLALVRAYLSVIPAALRVVTANRQRIVNLPAYIWRRLRLQSARRG